MAVILLISSLSVAFGIAAKSARDQKQIAVNSFTVSLSAVDELRTEMSDLFVNEPGMRPIQKELLDRAQRLAAKGDAFCFGPYTEASNR